MVENKALVKLAQYRITSSDLDKLTQDQKAAYAVLCYSISEINALQRMYLCSGPDLPEAPELVAAVAMQRNLLIRVLSSKLFELREFLKFEGKYNRTKDSALTDFGKSFEDRLSALDDCEGFRFAKRLRNEGSFHYHLKPTRARLEWVHPSAQSSMYISKAQGSNFFPYGEEVLYEGLLNEFIGSMDDEVAARELLESWAEWSMSFIREANKLFTEFFLRFIEPASSTQYAREKVYWVSPEVVSEIGGVCIPAFLRTDKGI